jgi:hypothetical protein
MGTDNSPTLFRLPRCSLQAAHIYRGHGRSTNEEDEMGFRHQLYSSVAATVMAALAMGLPAVVNAQEPEVATGQGGIGGVVTGPNGPEAGVWVIAETTDLRTKFAKIVVTDDQGRYLIPDLPQANYSLWVSTYDPATEKFTLISTCFPTHHLIFAEDANNTLWASTGVVGPGAVGWLNRKLFEETGDEQKSQGWTSLILDTNGNGKRDEYVEPDQPLDPGKDKRVSLSLYSIALSPADGSVWGTALGYPGYVVRINPGPDPTHTALTELYEPPFPGYGPRGGDIDRKGVFWASLASGHLASFDRGKCKVLNGPTATGKHCPEGWTLIPYQVRSSETSRNPVAPRRAITPGSISSTRSV